MAAFQELMPASFRGVSALCPEGTKDGGRHAVKHEYPDSSTRFVEDNGLCVPDFKVHFVVHGGLAQMRRFEAALNTPGPGTLVHPYHGRQFVQAGKYHLKHDDKDVGVFTFDCEFFVTGPASFPGLISGIAASITGLSATSILSLFALFQQGISLASVAALGSVSLGIVSAALQGVSGTLSTAFGDVAKVQSIAHDLQQFPERALGNIAGLTASLTALVRAPFNESTVSQDRLWRGNLALLEKGHAITAQADAVVPTTLDLALRQTTLTTLGTAIQAVAFASLCEAAAGKRYATAEQVSGDIATLSLAHETVTALSIAASAQLQLTDLLSQTVAVLLKEQLTLPDVRAIKVATMPASVLAYQLYETDAYLDTIVGLNAGLNPILYNGTVNILRNA